jgi:hypothetical protein
MYCLSVKKIGYYSEQLCNFFTIRKLFCNMWSYVISFVGVLHFDHYDLRLPVKITYVREKNQIFTKFGVNFSRFCKIIVR